MKKKKILKILMFVCIGLLVVGIISGAAVGISKANPKVSNDIDYDISTAKTVQHTHYWSNVWSSDMDYHWHATTCEHDLIRDKEAHTVVEDAAVAPTCLSDGLTQGFHCSVCGKVLTAQQVIPALSPDYQHHYDTSGGTCTICGEREVIVMGFSGLSDSSGVLTWLGCAEGLADYSKTTSGNYVSVTSPLDSIYPYSAMTTYTDTDGNVFMKYPKVYMKWITNSAGNIDGVYFSNVSAPNGDTGYFLSDAYLKPNSTTEYNDYFYMGVYEGYLNDTKLESKSGKTAYVNCTRDDCRQAARAYGTAENAYAGYQQEDMSMLVVYNFLTMMYYRTANIQTVYAGRTDSQSASATGTCDGVTGLNGWNTNTHCVKMLGIENPYGNINKFIDGVFFVGNKVYFQRQAVQFADSTDNAEEFEYNRPTSSGYVKFIKFGSSAATESYVYVTSIGGSSSTYEGDQSYYDANGADLSAGGNWSYGSFAGLWALNGNFFVSSSASSRGCRLCFRSL